MLEENKDYLPVNLNKPIKEIIHSELTRYGDSEWKSKCPVCTIGLLFVSRNNDTFRLQGFDMCMSCGQQFQYKDIDKMRESDYQGKV